jgi:hypothetical protein
LTANGRKHRGIPTADERRCTQISRLKTMASRLRTAEQCNTPVLHYVGAA